MPPRRTAPQPDTTAARVRDLRSEMALTGEEFAARCGLERVEVVQLETGKNKGTSYASRAALAKGADVPIEALAAYLDGEIPLPALAKLRGSGSASSWWRSVAVVHAGADHTPPEGSAIVPRSPRRVG